MDRLEKLTVTELVNNSPPPPTPLTFMKPEFRCGVQQQPVQH